MLITDVLQSDHVTVLIGTIAVHVQAVCTLCTSVHHNVLYKSTVICRPVVAAGRFVLSYTVNCCWSTHYLHLVSKKLCKLIFCQNFAKFRPMVKIFGTKIAERTSFWAREKLHLHTVVFLRYTHFPPHLIYDNALPCETQMFKIVT